MRLRLDEWWRDTHFAFVANRDRARDLAGVFSAALEEAADAWRAKAPDGWEPAEESGLFLPAGPPPSPSEERLGERLDAFHERHAEAVLVATAPLPGPTLAALAELVSASTAPPRRALAAALAEPDFRTSITLAEWLEDRLAREAELLRIRAPSIIVANATESCDELADLLVRLSRGEAEPVAQWVRSLPPISATDAVELAVEPGSAPLRVGGAPDRVLFALEVGGTELPGEWVLVDEDGLHAFEGASERAIAAIEQERGEYEGAAEDLECSERGYPSHEVMQSAEARASVQARAEASIEQAMSAARALGRRARELAETDGAVVYRVIRDEGR